VKTFHYLRGAYEGLRVRRLQQFGRIVLDQIINDPPAYWFVTVRNYDEVLELKRQIDLFPDCRWGNGNWRSCDLERAKTHFAKLCSHPDYVAEGEKAQKLRVARKERIKALQQAGKMRLVPPIGAKINPSNEAPNLSELLLPGRTQEERALQKPPAQAPEIHEP